MAYIQPRVAALEAWLTRASWQVRLLGAGNSFDAAALDEALGALRARGSISFMRGDKPRSIGLDTTLVGWELRDAGTEGAWRAIDLALETRSSNLGALRPAVLVEAAFELPQLADASLDSTRVLRSGQWHEEPDGSLVDPMAAELRI